MLIIQNQLWVFVENINFRVNGTQKVVFKKCLHVRDQLQRPNHWTYLEFERILYFQQRIKLIIV